MGKTYKDQNSYDDRKGRKGNKKKFPRVPPITKRSEPFDDKRRQEKYPDRDGDGTDGDYYY